MLLAFPTRLHRRLPVSTLPSVASQSKLSLPARLEALRAELQVRRLDGFIVPRADEFQGEYVPPAAQRLAWLTGFTGSAGMAIVLGSKAVIFVDGRYQIQVRAQVDPDLFAIEHLVENPPHRWLAENLPAGLVVGYDPWLHTADAVEQYRAAVEKAGGRLAPVESNPLDGAWTDRPAPPLGPVVPHPVSLAGRSSADKRREIADVLRKDHVDAAVMASPDCTAWLLNVRGSDVPCTPLPLSFAIIDSQGAVQWFVDERKMSAETRAHVGDEVVVAGPQAFLPALDALAGKRVLFDSAGAAEAIRARLEQAGAKLVKGADPCMLPKACKNDVELEGARSAHRTDAVAMCRFLAWLSREAPSGSLGEIAASDRLEAFRRECPDLRDLSFDTISGAGSNGAIVHYKANPETERQITPGELYLIDSGGQYPEGTTDITRTVAVGTPPPEAREHFTRVLQGHIALTTTRFPQGTTGAHLDAIARRPLWQAGLDYDHGTGHGVGSYLSVHEGPHRISKMPNATALRPGMIVSNEPGYYREGAYGIRIENLVVVVPVRVGERDMLGFEPLTLVPLDRNLVARDLLTADEVAWIDAYHRDVRETVASLLDEETRAWLVAATEPL